MLIDVKKYFHAGKRQLAFKSIRILFSLVAFTLCMIAMAGAATIDMDDSSSVSVTSTLDQASDNDIKVIDMVETTGAVCSLAPVNPEFTEHQTKKSAFDISSYSYGLGYTPSPVDLSNIKESQARMASVSPSYFDLRPLGKVTAVRDQGSSGSCWTFATYASLESYLLTAEMHDFSENNMKNLLNNWSGSNYQERFDVVEGGNAWMSAAYLARWSGPINESDDPYSTVYGTSPAGLSEKKHVQEILWLSGMSAIKDALMDNGAVQMSFYWDSGYYNATDFSYYYDGSSGSNHAVVIVGWDDDFTSPEKAHI